MADQVDAPEAAGSAPTAAGADAAERLAALGYVDVPQQFPKGAVPDPRAFVGTMGLVDTARMLALDGRVGASIRVLEALASSPIARPLALTSLAPLYLLTDRGADAVRVSQALVALTPGPTPRIMLARALLAQGHADEALDALRDVSGDGAAPSPLVRVMRARILLQAGRPADALGALGSDLHDDEAIALASRAHAAEDGARSEIAHLEEVLRAAPSGARLVETRAALAALLEEDGRDAEAVTTLEAAPHPPPEYRARLAEIAARHGNPERAAALYESVVAERPPPCSSIAGS